jgi:hypothetical protein
MYCELELVVVVVHVAATSITARLQMVVALLLGNFLALSALAFMSQLNPVYNLVSYFFCISCNTTHLSGFPINVLYSSHAPWC